MRSPFLLLALLFAATVLISPLGPGARPAEAQLLNFDSLTGSGGEENGGAGGFSPDSMIDRTTSGVGVFRERLAATFERLPFAVEEMRATLAAASPNGEPSYFVGVVLITTILILIGRAVATLVAIYMFQPILVRAQVAEPVGVAGKLPVLALRMVLTLLGAVIVVGVAVGLGLFFVIDHPPTQKTAAIVIVTYVVIFMVDTAWRMAISPYLPRYRIPRISDVDARKMYRWMSVGVAVGVIAQAFGFWMLELALPAETHAVVAVALSFVTVLLIEAMIWSNRRAITGAILGGRSRAEATRPAAIAAMVWLPAVMLYFAVAWVENSIRLVLGFSAGVQLLAGAFIALMLGLVTYAVTVFAVEIVSTRRRHAVTSTEAAEAPREADAPVIASEVAAKGGRAPAARDAPPRRGMRTYEDLGRRVASLLALGVGAYTLVRFWGGAAVLEEGTVADTAGDIIDTLLIGYIVYHAVRIWIDRKIEEEGAEENFAEPGEEGGGASAASRLATLLPLFRSFILITIVVTIVLLVATDLGVNVAPLFAGAGVVGLAIGFGAQTLVRDILSGMFFLLDDAFRKGEYIDVGDVKGTVEKISLRSFQLRHHLGALHTIPFGEIKHLTNFSRDWVMMKLPLRLTYDTDVEKVRKLIKKLGQELLQHPVEGPKFVQPLKSQGVYMMEDSAMIVRVKYMTRPGDQWTTRKLVYSRIREVFAENGVNFAHREVTVRIPGLPASRALSEEEQEAVGAAARSAVDMAEEEKAARPGPDYATAR